VDIVVEDFEFKQSKIGRVEMLANPHGDGWLLNKFLITTPDYTLSADGVVQGIDLTPNTKINFTWKIEDIGKTMDRFGHPKTIKGGSADLTGNIKWAGRLHTFEVNKLGGDLQLEARSGQVLKIETGVGRLISVLSLQNLARRLTFDFRDVFSSGFTFDTIRANVQLDQGIMKSKNFKMEGPTAKVEIGGNINLVQETQDLDVKITPFVTGSLSLAAFAGGPAVGVAALVAQKLLQNPIDKLASYGYHITGTWDNPQEVGSRKTQAEPVPEQTPLPFGN